MTGKGASFLEMLKFSHSVFALPFALASMLIAAGGWPGTWTFFWIVVAVVAARTAAMVFNRLADRDVDARNPRTAGRALVTGEISTGTAFAALVASSAVFFVAAAMLNWLCLVLSPFCLAVLLGYSVTKRFTDWSHVVLGVALGLAPVGAWIAVTGSLAWTPVLLGATVTLWVAGFDVLYACQDYEADKAEEGLYSIPKSRGLAGAMVLARRLHAWSLFLLLVTWMTASPPLGLLTLLGVAGFGLALRYEHTLVSPRDLSRLNAAFFTANGLISIGLFLIIWLDL